MAVITFTEGFNIKQRLAKPLRWAVINTKIAVLLLKITLLVMRYIYWLTSHLPLCSQNLNKSPPSKKEDQKVHLSTYL